ncbi:Intraflagellar transport protein 46 [Gonapodya sp. JEL0774]|nr:Intraflagellar transport protein 46 [Gonapodya sp. JEL0774]
MDASDSEGEDGIDSLDRGDTPPVAKMSDGNGDYDQSEEDELSSLPRHAKPTTRPQHNSSRRVRPPLKPSTTSSSSSNSDGNILDDDDLDVDPSHRRAFTDDPSSAMSRDPDESHVESGDRSDENGNEDEEDEDEDVDEDEDDIGTSTNGVSEPSSAAPTKKRPQGGKTADPALRTNGGGRSPGSPLGGYGDLEFGSGSLSGSGSAARDIQELFSYVGKFKPHEIELEPELRVFLPEYIPAVGDIDAFIKIPRPDTKPDTLGLTVLDEPAAKQSDPHVLALHLRSLSKTSHTNPPTIVPTVPIASLAQNPKPVDQWIKGIEELHRGKPRAGMVYTRRVPDVEEVMQAWDEQVEGVVAEVQLPPATIDLPLPLYAALTSILLDIPVPAATLSSLIASASAPITQVSNVDPRFGQSSSLVESLHLIFSAYSEFRNSQHFGTVGEGASGVDLEPASRLFGEASKVVSASRAGSSTGTNGGTAHGQMMVGEPASSRDQMAGGFAGHGEGYKSRPELPALPPLPPMGEKDKSGFGKVGSMVSGGGSLGWGSGATAGRSVMSAGSERFR